MNKTTKKQIFNPNQNEPGKQYKSGWRIGNQGINHPPKKNITFNELIRSILEYSPNEKSAKPIAEYSTL
jgi:hypothetical protein